MGCHFDHWQGPSRVEGRQHTQVARILKIRNSVLIRGPASVNWTRQLSRHVINSLGKYSAGPRGQPADPEVDRSGCRCELGTTQLPVTALALLE